MSNHVVIGRTAHLGHLGVNVRADGVTAQGRSAFAWVWFDGGHGRGDESDLRFCLHLTETDATRLIVDLIAAQEAA